MKKILSIVLSLVLVLSLASCSSNSAPAEQVLTDFVKELNSGNLEKAGTYTTTPEGFSKDAAISGLGEEYVAYADQGLALVYALLAKVEVKDIKKVSDTEVSASFTFPDVTTISADVANEMATDDSILSSIQDITDQNELESALMGIVFDRLIETLGKDDVTTKTIDYTVTFEKKGGELKISNADSLLTQFVSM